MSRVIEVVRRGRRGLDGATGIKSVNLINSDRGLSQSDSAATFVATAALTITLPDPATIASGWFCHLDALGGAITVTSTGDINGSASDLSCPQGSSVFIFSDSNEYFVRFFLDGVLTAVNSDQVSNSSSVAGATVTTALNNLQALASGKQAQPEANGIVIRTGAGTAVARSVIGSGAGLTVNNGSGEAGDIAVILNFATKEVAEAGTDFIYPMNPLSTKQAFDFNRDASLIGWGQTWQDVLSSRTHSTSYQNTTGRPIAVAIRAQASFSDSFLQVSSDDSAWVTVATFSADTPLLNASVIVPSGHYYRVDGTIDSIQVWAELR